MSHVSVVCLAAAKIADTDTQIVPTHHTGFGELEGSSTKYQIVQRLLPYLYPSADRIIAVSDGLADGIIEHTPVDRKDISVLHNPIPVQTIRKQAEESVDHEWINDDDTPVVLFVGRIERQKNLKMWLRTFRRVHNRHPDTRGILVGQGSQRTELLSLAERLGIADVISMPGYVDNPYGYMNRADAFLLSSRYEGLPTVLIEALACGCPVVATDCPSGPREILADGEFGHLTPMDNPEKLADAVVQTLTDPLPPEKLRSRADDFAVKTVVNDYEQFIQTYVVD